MSGATQGEPLRVVIGPHHLEGLLGTPPGPQGLVIFAHGSGSGRFSPRNNYVARRLEAAGFATLLLDLLTPEEEGDRRNVFDIELLASRLVEATRWARQTKMISRLEIGYFGASTGGGAALVASSLLPEEVSAVVSRGGRPDLAADALSRVKSPTLLLVGGKDSQVIELNRWALRQMRCPVELRFVPGATHLFEEPGALDQVVKDAIDWFTKHLRKSNVKSVHLPLSNRRSAGRLLAERLQRFRQEHPLVLALPRGGVPVAHEVAAQLGAQLDILLVRKIGAPGHPEFGIGAVIDGENPQILLNQDMLSQVPVGEAYIKQEATRQLQEIERRRDQYLGDREPIPVTGRTVIVVDDGVATGSTVRIALRAIRQKRPAKLILAVPVGASDSLRTLTSECDEVVCLAMPEPFRAVGAHYANFDQTTDDEVRRLLNQPTEIAIAK